MTIYAKYLDKGSWRVVTQHANDGGETYLESDDFTNDVRLYVNGGFATKADCELYAMAIMEVLNSHIEAVT